MLNSGRPHVQPQGLASAGRTAEASAREREFQRKAEWVVAAEDEARRGDVAERGVGEEQRSGERERGREGAGDEGAAAEEGAAAAALVGAKRTDMCSCHLQVGNTGALVRARMRCWCPQSTGNPAESFATLLPISHLHGCSHTGVK